MNYSISDWLRLLKIWKLREKAKSSSFSRGIVKNTTCLGICENWTKFSLELLSQLNGKIEQILADVEKINLLEKLNKY